MEFIRVASVRKGPMASTLSLHLLQQNIRHELAENGPGFDLLVDKNRAQEVAQWLNKLSASEPASNESREGDGEPRAQEVNNPAWPSIPWKNFLQVWPITCAMIVLGLIGYLLTKFDSRFAIVTQFTFTQIHGAYLLSYSANYEHVWQLWRLVTPAFLHFGFMHILFNGVWIWEFGRRLESYLGRSLYFFSFLSIAIFSNCLQYAMQLIDGDIGIFGGLSGVVFGFLGMLWVLSRRSQHPLLSIPQSLYIVSIASMVLFMTGVLDLLFGVKVANTAHVAGLLAGIVLGYVLPLKPTLKFEEVHE